jgi:hypothetical protein
MQASAPRAIRTRLHLWKTFFETGADSTPPGATNAEYDYEHLIDIARDTDIAELHDLADVVELMAHNYIVAANIAEAELLMLDDAPAPATPVQGARCARHIRITMAELNDALRG